MREQEKAANLVEGARKIYHNLTPAELIEMAIVRKEGNLTSTGALRVATGKYTGRSPNDKFIVDVSAVHNEISWGSNKAFSDEKFDKLYNRMMAYIQNREVFVFDGFAGADPENRITVRFINEFAWQNLFVHQLFVRPNDEQISDINFKVICMPGFKAIPSIDGTNSEAFIVLNFEKNMVLIGGTHYAGEMKKSIFSVMNYILPKKGIMSMHCSANVGSNGESALFFGLSGTGKTTLSADSSRQLIGDDEHGWSENGIFNIEGGCYAKCIRLSKETEPEIWEAIRFGTVLENVYIDDETRVPDYDNDTITENSRAAYPIDHIPNALVPSIAGHPKTIVFLTADAFGVLPPIAKLTKEQAMYHFLSGYTSKLAGTERGVTEPEATFSTCFGAPFLPLSPLVYAKLLGEKLEKHNTNVYLINTGWSGGPYGVGKRMKLSYTRSMVRAAIEGKLETVSWQLDPIFNVYIPNECPDVPTEVLNPRNTWADKDLYDKQARYLAQLFTKNFNKFKDDMPVEIITAGPKV
ncbi:phosphoenolpyruvate carboxykinase (ATP) [Dendrosporobacter sp. 1207_IL3150]|uniref:phosphoenolpyruvate carboxykinase (ATP) n=1 Tax=Dendrosporobacter sp. 1207_IL3150 TaxID=3084054 RepID=UPI002FD9812F